jgi:hypothetical protein
MKTASDWTRLKVYLPIASEETPACIPADLRLGPRCSSGDLLVSRAHSGVWVWTALANDLRQPFSRPFRGVMGSGSKPQNG